MISRSGIVWNSDAYQELGEGYAAEDRITCPSLLNNHLLTIRADKRKEIQKERTKKCAEVFTPLHIIDKMNMHMHEAILEEAGGDWRKYINKTVLEITCGEAPFLTTRYDPATGELAPLQERIGLLDRKFQAIESLMSEERISKQELIGLWLEALMATYGYELAGDNLMIARLNLFLSAMEWLKAHVGGIAPHDLEYVAKIIACNLIQMDGLTYKSPATGMTAIVYDWNNGKWCPWDVMGKGGTV